MKKILIMGLPGSGKTTLAKKLKASLKADWLNADKVRKKYKDWDFSRKGVLKQAKRMKILDEIHEICKKHGLEIKSKIDSSNMPNSLYPLERERRVRRFMGDYCPIL